jgi:outer membrane lipoprotein-sorting protein
MASEQTQTTTTARRAQRWRWAVPVAVAAAAALVIGVRPIVADASPTLPHRTAAELLASLPASAHHPFSGTVETTARLGLPDLPSSVQGQHAPLSITSLLTGTHTLRVWYAGPDRQRVALVSDLAEADVIRDGQDAWAWSSDSRGGVHLRLPDHRATRATRAPTPSLAPTSPMPGDLMRDLTPQRLAEQLLSAVEPTTEVTVDGTATVAGRSAYELVVAPRDHRSLIAQIRLAVDARTSLPLRLQVFSSGATDPAIESGFTSIRYGRPSDDVFRAPDVPLRELTVPRHPGNKPSMPSPARQEPKVHGSSWTTVLELPNLPDLAALTGSPGLAQPRVQGKGDTDGKGGPDIPPADDTIVPADPLDGSSAAPPGNADGPSSTMGDSLQADQLLQTLLRSATPVSGTYGSGRLLRTALVSVLMLDDGRVFVGAVTPATLEQAATSSPRS